MVNLISKGNVRSEFNSEDVLTTLTRQFKLAPEQAQKLISQRCVIKKNLTEDEAKRIGKQLSKAGLDVALVKAPTAEQPEQILLSSAPTNRKQLEECFAAAIPAPKVSSSYKASLALVTLLSLLTPLIYFGLMAGMGFGGWMYLSMVPDIVDGGGTGFTKLILITMPPLMILILLLFMAKPLLPRKYHNDDYVLKKQQFPWLYDLVEVMCARIGVPAPQVIAINNEVNASAGSNAGLVSLLRGKLRLTVGMPLIAGMSSRQLVGVLAHEFGHFAQFWGLAAYYLINSVNHWLADRAYNPDEWDERLARWMQNEYLPIYITATLYITQKAILGIRWLFHFMYKLNKWFSSSMSRHMEYDADSYESYVAGSDGFAENSLKLRRLSYARSEVNEVNHMAWNQNRLLRDIASATADIEAGLSDEVVDQLRNSMTSAETDAWDSHPADTDRIQHAESRQNAGCFRFTEPASNLCPKFSSISEALTKHSYVHDGVYATDDYIVDNAEIFAGYNQKNDADRALNNYYATLYHGPLLMLEEPVSEQDRALDWQQCVNAIRELLPELDKNEKAFDKAFDAYHWRAVGTAAVISDIPIREREFGLTTNDASRCKQETQDKLLEINNIFKQTERPHQLLYKRMQFAAHQSGDDIAQQRLQRLVKHGTLGKLWAELHQQIFTSRNLIELADEPLTEAVLNQLEVCKQALGISLKQLTVYMETHPCLVAANNGSMADFAHSWTRKHFKDVNAHTVYEVIDHTETVLNAFKYQYHAELAEFAQIAEAQEKAADISPLRVIE